MKKIFLSINLPNELKKELASFKDSFKELPIRWVDEENLHITLSFLGYLDNKKLNSLYNTIEDILSNYNSFSLNLNKICYQPEGKEKGEMIWVKIEENEILNKLITEIKKRLLIERETIFHITLGRIKKTKWRSLELEELPDINKDISINIKVNSIEIMESVNKKHRIIRSIELN